MTIEVSFIAFLASFLVLIWVLRRDRLSLGLPVAYFLAFSLEHAPGAYSRLVSRGLYGDPAVDRGFFLATVGATCFVTGVVVMHTLLPKFAASRQKSRRPAQSAPITAPAFRRPLPRPATPVMTGPEFRLFCLIAGWIVVYGISALLKLPSVGAIVEKGGAVWMLGVMLGLVVALRRGDPVSGFMWLSALAVYPVMMLLFGGFLSYGSAAVIICTSVLLITSKSLIKSLGVLVICAFVGLSIFVNYFDARDSIRGAVWGGASLNRRVDVVLSVVEEFKFFDASNPRHLRALDMRLNQNYFVGLASDRLQYRYVEYLEGRSIWEGVISLVPRALWPDKPVYGGSGTIVREMTGLNLSLNTSWGVGQVMEFYINYAMQGLIIGFLILGGIFGWLDRKAALSLRMGQQGQVFLYFLPCAALIQPIGSLVELTGGGGAALAAAFIWRTVWSAWRRRQAEEAQYARLVGQMR